MSFEIASTQSPYEFYHDTDEDLKDSACRHARDDMGYAGFAYIPEEQWPEFYEKMLLHLAILELEL